MDEIKFAQLQRQAQIEVIDTFNKSTLKRTLTSPAALKHLSSYNKNMKKILNNKNLSQAQFLELNNMVTSIKKEYTDRVTEKNKIKTSEKSKLFRQQVKDQLKKETPKVTTVKQDLKTQKVTATINPNLSDLSKNSLTGLLNNAAKVAGVESPIKKTTALSIISRDDKINFNLKGFALIQDITQNSLHHGYLDSDIDKGVKDNKITKSEAKNIKSFFNLGYIADKVKQARGNDPEYTKRIFSSPYQSALNNFLSEKYNTVFTKMPKDVTPPKGGGTPPKAGGSSSKSGMNFIDKFTKKFKSSMKTGASMGAVPTGGGGKTAMQQALGMYDPFSNPGPYMNKGGRVPSKRKPYAMGGKVYSNSTRKPKFK